MKPKPLIALLTLAMTVPTFAQDAAPDAEMQAAQTRIEQIRKGDFTIRVTGTDGKPLANARVEVEMTRHAFPFGTAVNADRLRKAKPGDPYLENIPKLFNRATLENHHKWRWQDDPEKRVNADAATDWLLAHDMTIHGHALVWSTLKYNAMPQDVREKVESGDADKAEYLGKRALKNIAETGARYRGKVVDWDVVNENFAEHVLTPILNPGAPINEAPILVDWYQAARRADPNARLYINDFGILVGDQTEHKDAYERTIRYLLKEGAPLQGIGMQSHVIGTAHQRTPAQLKATLDRFAQFGLPLQITEFDIGGDGWGDTPAAIEKAQADYFRTFLTMAFSHPAVEAFTMWGFWDGQHWFGNAPLFRKDWTPKPGYAVYSDLVLNQWMTRAQGETDANGIYRFRGFYGDYTIQARPGKATLYARAKLRQTGDSVNVGG